jgi:hypothetical protein
LVCIDETGHEEFADPTYPVFGLGGCAVLAEHYAERLAFPWRDLKAKHFGGGDAPLHAAELLKPNMPQLEALADFFRNGLFSALRPCGRTKRFFARE